MAWNQVVDLSGSDGADGEDGISVVDAEIRGDGHLWVTLSNDSEIDAGTAKGDPGGGIDFESSVQSVEDLPSSSPYGEARYVRDDGHLYVYEPAEDRPDDEDGWTDVGPIRGETGDDGADGVSVTDATVNGSGELVLTLSDDNTINAGSVVGPDGPEGPEGPEGPAGADGDDGERGPGVFGGSGSPDSESGYITGDYYIDEDTGILWKLN